MKNISPIVSLNGISKSFNDISVIDRVSLHVFPGEIIGLVGANGSGKSTLAKIISGATTPDEGEICIAGHGTVSLASSYDAISIGVRALSQSTEIYPHLSVLENIFIGQEIVKGPSWMPLMNWSCMKERAGRLLERVGSDARLISRKVKDLSGGQQKAVALARVLAYPAKVLIFDEPDAALGIHQKSRLINIMREEAAAGCAVIFISHDLKDVFTVCTRIFLLINGKAGIDIDVTKISEDKIRLMQMESIKNAH